MSAEVSDERLRQAVREVLAEELDDDAPTATRRQVLGSIAAGGILGGVAGAGSAAGAASTVNGTPASLGTVASNVYKWADPGGLSGPYGSRANASNYDTGRIHVASDTGTWSYDTGSSWNTLPLAKNHIKFSNGRVYGGRFTGTNDAQVLIDALADRPAGEGIVLQDPGFALDWEQQVDLPTDEPDFALETIGMPRIVPASGFSGTAVLNRPATTSANNDDQTGYRIGSFAIDDSVNGAASRGIVLDDLKSGYVAPCKFFDVPPIYLKASNGTTNDITIDAPYMKTSRGPGIEMQGGASNRADQITVRGGYFNDRFNESETAIRDRGNDNRIESFRIESAATAYHVGEATRGGEGYFVEEHDWDRISDNEAIIEEANAEGEIRASKSDVYTRSRIVSPITYISGIGESTGGGPQRGPINVFKRLEQATEADTLGSVGLNSFGAGSGGFTLAQTGKPVLQGTTDTTAGNAAGVNLGGSADTLSPASNPKFAMRTGGTVDTTNVLIRIGFEDTDGDLAQLIYDPTDSLAEAPTTGNWFLRVETDGVVANSTDLGVSPSSGQLIAVGRYGSAADAIWYARVGETVVEENVGSNQMNSNIEWEASVETQTSAAKQFDLSTEFGARLWRTV